jgi:LysR family glycine cleavage system transcriptional activator
VVCSPALLAGLRSEDDAAAVSRGPLIRYEWSGFSQRDFNWSSWFATAGLDGAHIPTNAVYSDEHMCIQEAIDGNGFALVGLIAAADDIVEGRLVSSVRLPGKSYYLIYPEPRASNPRVAAFREWLLEEADIFRESPAGELIENHTVRSGLSSEMAPHTYRFARYEGFDAHANAVSALRPLSSAPHIRNATPRSSNK